MPRLLALLPDGDQCPETRRNNEHRCPESRFRYPRAREGDGAAYQITLLLWGWIAAGHRGRLVRSPEAKNVESGKSDEFGSERGPRAGRAIAICGSGRGGSGVGGASQQIRSIYAGERIAIDIKSRSENLGCSPGSCESSLLASRVQLSLGGGGRWSLLRGCLLGAEWAA